MNSKNRNLAGSKVLLVAQERTGTRNLKRELLVERLAI